MPVYEPWDERPLHPITGVPADYYWQTNDGQRHPRWRNPFLRGPSLDRTWYSVAEISEMTGVHRATVTRWLTTGKLQGNRVMHDGASPWFVRGDHFMAFMGSQSKHVAVSAAEKGP